MNETMGQIIRRLRKERNLTQDELAERLNVTGQAISRWENETGMPDISQVVPLSRVLGVSTDVLFGTAGTNDNAEVRKILEEAQSKLDNPLTMEGLKRQYAVLMDALKLYPNNVMLLMHCLEAGLSLAYPDNDGLYDSEHGVEIYKECIREARIMLAVHTNASDLLRTHMIMILLHCAYGNFEEAWKLMNNFPCRADMTVNHMLSYYFHWKKDYKSEAESCEIDMMFQLEAMLNNLTHLYETYMELEQYNDAAEVLEYAVKLIDITAEDEEVLPHMHWRESGDIYKLLAEVYVKLGRFDDALAYLGKMVTYDVETCKLFRDDMKMKTPLLRDVKDYNCYRVNIDRFQELHDKLTDKCFDSLRGNPVYEGLLEKAEMKK